MKSIMCICFKVRKHVGVHKIFLGKPPLSAHATVRVEIVNRKVPIFTRHLYRGRIPENASPGSSVLTVQAVSNIGGRIGYMIKDGDDRSQFKIDFDTGM